MKTPSPQLLFTLGIFLCVSISCKKIGCISEWADDRRDDSHYSEADDCWRNGDHFVGTYTMHFLYDDQYWVDNGNGTISWVTVTKDYVVDNFEISMEEGDSMYYVSCPGKFYNISIPGTRTDSVLELYYNSGGTLTYSTFIGEAVLSEDSLFLDLSYNFYNWGPGFNESTHYLARGIRNE